MNYIIKEIYNQRNQPTGYFAYPKMTRFNVQEDHGRWLISGSLDMYSNSILPYYSFYLNADTSYFKVSDIKLEYIQNKKTYSNYRIDQYDFDFGVSLSNSELYQKTLTQSAVRFDISFYFNQNILREFNVKYNSDDVQRLVRQVQQIKIETIHDYANTWVLKDTHNAFNIYDKQKEQIDFEVPSFSNLTTPIKTLATIHLSQARTLQIKQLRMRLKYQINSDDTWYNYEEQLENIVAQGEHINIDLPFSYSCNPTSKTIERTVFNGNCGILIPFMSHGFMNVELILNTGNEDKKVVINREFNFQDNSYDATLASLRCENYEDSLKWYQEVKYGY